MKKALLALAFLVSAPAFAADFGPQFGPNRFFCYYRDSMGYSHGAGGTSLGQAKGRARSECQQSEHRRDRFLISGSCTFIGCRQVR
jgi:hypothetical protein